LIPDVIITQQSDTQDSFCPASLKEAFSTNTGFATAATTPALSAYQQRWLWDNRAVAICEVLFVF